MKETRDPNWTHGPIKRKKGTWRGTKFPFVIEMVPLKVYGFCNTPYRLARKVCEVLDEA